MIRSYLDNMIDNLTAFGESKIHLTIKMNFKSSKDIGKSQPMYSKRSRMYSMYSDNTEVMIGNNTSNIIDKLFSSLFSRYQIVLEALM